MPKPNSDRPDYSREREFKVILEDLQSQFRVFGEGQEMLRQEVEEIKGILASKADKADLNRFFHVLNDHESRITTLEKN